MSGDRVPPRDAASPPANGEAASARDQSPGGEPRRGAPAVPGGRTMPKEDRLKPPVWEEGRTEAPNGRFFTIGK